jgi:hypothetical protein
MTEALESKSMTVTRSGLVSGPAVAVVTREETNWMPAEMRRLEGSVSWLEPDESMTTPRRRPVQSFQGSSRVRAQTIKAPRLGP